MYGHPSNPDPWAERQAIQSDEPAQGPSGFTVAFMVIALPAFALSFAAGYVTGAWGWL